MISEKVCKGCGNSPTEGNDCFVVIDARKRQTCLCMNCLVDELEQRLKNRLSPDQIDLL